MLDPLEERAKRAKARVGKTIRDKWVLGDVIGVGGMATVYAATHRNNGRRAAVKMLHPELSVVPQIKTRFLREGYASNQVEHTGAVSVLDDDTAEDGSVYLVMELLEGETLEQRRLARGGRLDMVEVLWATDQLLDVLVTAHAKGIIHRDIKPDNLFVTRAAQLKVLDFGLARVRPTPQRKGLTRTNVLMGTLDFMSPEQARGQWDKLDGRSDVWSVGATMFTLLTGCPVHPSRTGEEQLQMLTTKHPRSVATLMPELPSPVVRVVDKALRFSPADRWLTATAMQEAVREAFGEVGGAPTEPREATLVAMGDGGSAREAPPSEADTHADADAPVGVDLATPPVPAAIDFDSGVTMRWDPNARPSVLPPRPAEPTAAQGEASDVRAARAAAAVDRVSAPPASPAHPAPLAADASPPPTPEPTRARVNPLVVGGVAGGVLLMGLGLAWCTSRPAPEPAPSPPTAASSAASIEAPPSAQASASAAPVASAPPAPSASTPSKKPGSPPRKSPPPTKRR